MDVSLTIWPFYLHSCAIFNAVKLLAMQFWESCPFKALWHCSNVCACVCVSHLNITVETKEV